MMELRAEVLKARGAYSDMIMALSVVRRLINDLTIAKEGQAKAQFKEYPVSPMKKEGQHVLTMKEQDPAKEDIFQ